MALLTRDRQKEIDQVISNVYLTTNTTYPDSGLIDILRKYGIEVSQFDFGDDNVMGAIKYPDDGSQAVILVNKDKPSENKTFTTAHEFGHYLLHEHTEQYRIDYENLVNNGDDYKIEETEANYFAGSLLMPKKLLIELLGTTSDLNAIAKYFGVSRAALDVRLAWIRQNNQI